MSNSFCFEKPNNPMRTTELLSFLEEYTEPFNFAAVFSDESLNFVSNNEPAFGEQVTIRIRAARDNCDAVFLHENSVLHKMDFESRSSCGRFVFFTVKLTLAARLSYHFSITNNNRTFYYNKRGLFPTVDRAYDFELIPGFITPKWSRGAVYYQIYPDRFCNGDKTNDVRTNEYAYLGKAAKHIENWNGIVSNDDVCNFYGGDLQGIIDKLGYLNELGIDAIYLNPVFVSPSNHKYDIQDYANIDPHLGRILSDGGDCLEFEHFSNKYASKYIDRTTNKVNLDASNELFAELIEKAHSRGMKVILDGVFNHCGAFNKWLDREGFYYKSDVVPGAYRDECSPYHSYFKWFDWSWPNNDCYDSWWGHDNHPKLNYAGSPELREFIMQVGEKWVSPPYNADGWRLDVAADLGFTPEQNHDFYIEFNKRIKAANPEALIMAEHYGSARDWLNGCEWDTVMNYDAFMEPVTWFFTGMEKHSDSFDQGKLNNAMNFEEAMRYYGAMLPVQSAQTAMNELSNHDHSRFLTRTNMTVGRLQGSGSASANKGINKNILMSAVVLQMTWIGSPTLYYGDEAGLCGWTDPDNRRTYPWGNEDIGLIEFHKEMIAIHKRFTSIQTGSLEYIYNDNGFISFGRWNELEKVLVAINNNDFEKSFSLPVWKLGAIQDACFVRQMLTGNYGFTTENIEYRSSEGMLYVELGPYSSAVFVFIG